MRIETLLKYKSFGTQKQLDLMLENLTKSSLPVSITDLYDYYKTQTDYYFPEIDSSICLLEFVDCIVLKKSKIVSVNRNAVNPKEILELVLSGISKETEAAEFLSDKAIGFDVEKNLFYLENSLIPLRYSSIRNLLTSLDILKINKGKAYINKAYTETFELFITEVKNSYVSRFEKQLSLRDLKRILRNKELLGKKAEAIALEYERNRLKGHKYIQKIQIISALDCSAGYDIISFNNLLAKETNRYIEVKAFNNRFYFSNNEIEKSKLLKNNYFLYLVNIKTKNVLEIPNPYSDIFEKQLWNIEPDGFIITNK